MKKSKNWSALEADVNASADEYLEQLAALLPPVRGRRGAMKPTDIQLVVGWFNVKPNRYLAVFWTVRFPVSVARNGEIKYGYLESGATPGEALRLSIDFAAQALGVEDDAFDD